MKDRRTEFIKKALIVHTNENLDYSQVEYVNNKVPVKIIDHDLRPDGTEYGEFWQTPSNHLKGQGHPDKRGLRISKTKSSKQEEIIRRFKEVHINENLDYSEVEYVNMHTKVKIISHDLRPDGTEYGAFWQEPAVHLKGCTHPDIGKEKQHTSLRYNTTKFVELAKKIHKEDDYSYDYVDYRGSKTKVCIVCNKVGANGRPHGKFMTYPDTFLQGKGCPVCGNHVSRAEIEIVDFLSAFVNKKDIRMRDKLMLDGKEIDIYLPDYRLGIEFNGIRWHSEKFNKENSYHLEKTLLAADKGIILIQIFEDEYLMHKKLVFDKIANILGFNSNKPKIYARKCDIRKLTNKPTVKEFLDNNHIQGSAGYTVAYGAYNGDELVAVMTFVNEGDVWNLNRYCTDIKYRCPGVASKIFKHFVNDHKPLMVKSFLDRRWCFSESNNLYTKLGFKLNSVLKPDYRYTNGHGERKHKFGFRKQILHQKYGFPLTMTESEMTKELGYYKIWDCGLLKYVWDEQQLHK